MTVGEERYSAVLKARQFLRDLLDPKKHPKVPKKTRTEAYWVLRHFPHEYDMDMARTKAPKVWGRATPERK